MTFSLGKFNVVLAVIVVAAAIALATKSTAPVGVVTSTNTAVYFSPRGGCTEAVVRELGGAKQSIRVQAYSFSAPIARALVDAKRRGG